MPEKRLLELSGDRAIALVINNLEHRYTLRRIEEADWFAYYENLISYTERRGNETVRVADIETAGLKLVESVLKDATGYGGTPPASIEDWQRKLPLSHRTAIALYLTEIVGEGSTELIELGVEVVSLRALWSADENGNNVRHSSLVHRFRSPDANAFRRYTNVAKRTRTIGSGDRTRTVWDGPHKTLVSLYDELILEVEGYSADGKPLVGREEIAKQMDVNHKVTAITTLCKPEATVSIKESSEIA